MIDRTPLAPFKIGDVVTTSWPNSRRDGPHWTTRVLSIQRYDGAPHWLVVAAASEPCEHCHVVAHPQTPALGPSWFERKTP